jgi:conjugal transfer/type IV secretion protein DotA/TraY
MRTHKKFHAPAALALFLPSVAAAQLTGDVGTSYDELVLASQQPGDHSRNILENLLADFAQNPFTAVGQPDTLLGNLFFLFNSGIFIVGTALLSYFILSSVAQTAHEGEVLGKRINGLWVPIRVSLGVFGMLPVFGGFSLAQAVMMWFTILGIGLANIMTSQAISDTEMFNALIPPPGLASPAPETAFSGDLVRNIFSMNVCAAAARKHHEELTWTLSQAPEVVMKEVSNGHLLSVKNTSWGVECGQILLQRGELRDNSWNELGYRSEAVDYDSIKQVAEASYSAKLDQLDQIEKQMMQEASRFVDAYWEGKETNYQLDTSIFSSLAVQANAAVSNYVRAQVQASKEAGDAGASALTKAASESIRQGGWMSLGSWHSTYAEVQAALQTAAYHGQLKETPLQVERNSFNSSVTRLVDVATQIAGQPAPPAAEGTAEFKTNSPGRWLVTAIAGSAEGTGGTGMTNPITLAKTTGDLMISGAIGVYSLSTIAENIPLGSKVLDWVSGVPGVGFFGGMVGSVLNDLKTLLPIVAILLLVIGGTLSIYVPLIPFLTWFAALVGYFVSVIEGLVAAQIWAFGHVSLDGEGMGQKTEKGYQYLLNMLLRPPLMVLAFFFASALVILLGSFLIDGVRTLVENVQGNSATGLVSILGFLVIFAILLITLISSCFDMIFALPDRVISWAGSGMEFVAGRDMSSKIEGQATAASRWAGGAAHAANQGRGALQAARLRNRIQNNQGKGNDEN